MAGWTRIWVYNEQDKDTDCHEDVRYVKGLEVVQDLGSPYLCYQPASTNCWHSKDVAYTENSHQHHTCHLCSEKQHFKMDYQCGLRRLIHLIHKIESQDLMQDGAPSHLKISSCIRTVNCL